MTKTLTEQWREGTLPLGTYYILNINGDEEIDRSVAVGELWNNTDLKEVLATVPTYAEFVDLMSNLEYIDKYRELLIKTEQLENRLEIATKALKEYMTFCRHPAEEALKEMKGVK